MNAFPLRRLEAAAAVCGDDPEAWRWFLKGLEPPVQRGLFCEWLWQAHGGQAEPADAAGGGSDWAVWLLMAGRGFGKTLAGAQWTCARARETPGARIALVGATFGEVQRVMIEGPAGLFAAARSDEEMLWVPTRGEVTFANGATAFVYSAEAAEGLRGPEHDFAWCDELGKWDVGRGNGEAAWDNLMMGLRRGARPRTIVTTTPRATALLRRVRGLKATVTTNGRMRDNAHSAAAFRAWMEETYDGTRLGRQELDGELIEDVEGSLFPREVLEASRRSVGGGSIGASGGSSATANLPRLKRIVVGVDPPASAEGDACGIVVCGLGADGIAYVLADCSVKGLRPEGWARRVAAAAEAWEADRVIAEKNQGGDMVESVLRSVEANLPVRLVSASRGKAARAEPVAARFEGGKARLAGRFPELEDELTGMTVAGGYAGPGRSPDRADAMVWAMTELVKPPREPRVRLL